MKMLTRTSAAAALSLAFAAEPCRASDGMPAAASTASRTPVAPHSPCDHELANLESALAAKDVDKLESLLSPAGVECGDYVYGKAELDVLLRPKDGALRAWVFGDSSGASVSVLSLLKSGTRSCQDDAPGHRSVTLVGRDTSVVIGFFLKDGRWLIADGLLCQ